MTFFQLFNAQIQKYKMILPEDTIVVAVSGGPDSLALLDLLDQLRDEIHFKLICAHYNHGLREEADHEEENVKRFCEERRITFLSEKGNVRVWAKKRGLGLEEAAREMRYDFLTRTAYEEKARKIVLGHHADDQAETVLLHMIRGAGLEGLSGMKTIVQRGGLLLLRPLLPFKKDEILEYALKRELPYVIDATNQEEIYSRNKIRNKILPALGEIVPDPSGAINRTAENVREEKALLDKLLSNYYKKLILLKNGEAHLDSALFSEEDAVLSDETLQVLVIRECAKSAGLMKDFSRKHAFETLRLFKSQNSGRIDLPQGFEAVKMQQIRLIRHKEDKQKVQNGLFNPISIFDKNANDLLEENHVLMAVFANEKDACAFSATLKNPCRYTYLYDTMKKNISIRKRLPGDYIILKDGKRKKLKRFFIDEKIPSEQRGEIALLASGSEILWIPGLFSRRMDIPRTMHSEIHIAAEGIIK